MAQYGNRDSLGIIKNLWYNTLPHKRPYADMDLSNLKNKDIRYFIKGSPRPLINKILSACKDHGAYISTESSSNFNIQNRGGYENRKQPKIDLFITQGFRKENVFETYDSIIRTLQHFRSIMPPAILVTSFKAPEEEIKQRDKLTYTQLERLQTDSSAEEEQIRKVLQTINFALDPNHWR